MHSRIFCLARTIEPEDISNALYLSEEDVMNEIGADYIAKSENFEDDIQWLSNCYGCSYSFVNAVDESGNHLKVGKVNVKELIAGVEKEKQVRYEKIKEEMAKDNPDLWMIAYIAYLQKGFFFFIEKEIFNAIDLEAYIKNLEYIYVVSTYDYHF